MGLLDGVKKALLGEKAQGNSLSELSDQLDAAKGDIEAFNKIKMKVEEVRSSATRVAHEGVWMQNCAYTVGYAGLSFNTATRSFQPVNRGSALRKDRLQVNKILPTLQNRLAKLTKNPPRFDVRPNGNDQEAKDNARFKQDIVVSKWDELQINLHRQQLLMWVQQCGHAYGGICWDDTKGSLLMSPEGEPFYEGDVRFEVISPFEVFPDPLAKSFDECQHVIRAKVRPLSYFVNHYGEKGAEVKEEETWLLSLQFDTRINNMNTRGGSGGASQKNTAIELTYYEKPSLKHPKGQMIIGANGVILKKGELPTGKIPLAKFDDMVVAGKFYPEAVVTHLRPIQDQFNQVIRRRADWLKKMLAGKYVSPRGNEVLREAMTDENAEWIQYTPVVNAPNGGEPKALDIPLIPQYAYNEEDRLDSQFSEISGVSEVSKGQLPSASIPALGMQILVEADDTRIGVEVANHEFGYAQLAMHILDYVQLMYKVPRKMKFAGKNVYVIKDVKGSDLQGENDVIVVPGSTIPGSKALRRQEILNAYAQNLLGDPADPKVRQNVLSQLELGDVGEMFIDASLDQHRCKAELDAIKAGQLPDVAECFNHVIHLQELTRFRKSDGWEMLDEQAQENFEAVFEEHLRMHGELTGAQPAGQDEMDEANSIEQSLMPADATQGGGAPVDQELPQDQLPEEIAVGGL